MISFSLQRQEQLRNTNSYLLIMMAFFIPLSIAMPSIISAIILLVWLLLGDFKNDWKILKDNKVVLAVLLFALLPILGLLWSNSLEYGILYTIKKEFRLILIPIFMLFVQKEHIKYYIYAFLLATSISELSSYAIFFEFVDPFHKATQIDPTPFLGHITYNPLLAFATYILIHNLIFSKDLSNAQKVVYSLFAITMSINIFITGGRAGQVMYFAALTLLIFQYFSKQIVKAIFISILFIPLIIGVFYNSSDFFQARADMAIENISDYKKDINSSASIRINWAVNSFEIIKENPLIGVGSGDFRAEYNKVNERLTPHAWATYNPHNMYVFQTVEFGFLGLFILLSIFIFQIKHALSVDDTFLKNLGLALPLLFMVIMLSESYLLIPSTTYLFVLFSSFLYKRYPNEKIKN